MQKAMVVLDGLEFLNVVDCNKRGRSHWHFMTLQTLMNILKMKWSTTRYLKNCYQGLFKTWTAFPLIVTTTNTTFVIFINFFFSLNKEARLQMKAISK